MAIRAKLARAWEHVDTLYAETNAFSDSDSYQIVESRRESDGLVLVYTLKLSRPFPSRWTAIFGELVHDCRSALDQAVYRLALENTNPTAPSGTGFPIFADDDNNWTEKGLPQIAKLGQPVQDYIRSIQPFAAKGVVNRRIKSLHKYWTTDKHRAIVPWGLRIKTEDIERLVTDPPASLVEWTEGVHYDGSDVLTLTFAEPPEHVRTHGRVPVAVSIEDVAHKSADDGPVAELVHITSAVVHTLLGWHGRQIEPLFPITPAD